MDHAIFANLKCCLLVPPHLKLVVKKWSCNITPIEVKLLAMDHMPLM
jgi:hypothetical protein